MKTLTTVRTTEPARLRDYSNQQLALIRRTVAADCNQDEFDLFVEVARRVGLDPFRRQIYAVVYSKDNPAKRKMSIITGIDGFRAIAARNHDYRPDDQEPAITYSEALKNPTTNPLGIEKAVVRAYKLAPNGEWHAVVGVAYWDEYAPVKEVWEYSEEKGKRVPTGRFEIDHASNWFRMPRVMLPKAAEAQALRRGWPEDLSGIYTPEEMEQAQAIDLTPSAAADAHEADARLQLVHAKNTVAILWRAGEPIDFVPVGQVADRAMQFIAASESATELEKWRDVNSMGLREFWAYAKADALEVKKALEGRIQELSASA